jgi:hypothetical protein
MVVTQGAGAVRRSGPAELTKIAHAARRHHGRAAKRLACGNPMTSFQPRMSAPALLTIEAAGQANRQAWPSCRSPEARLPFPSTNNLTHWISKENRS